MRVAALDLGTNTFLLLIADIVDGRIERVIHDEVRIVRLGQGVHENRRFHPEALLRAEECLRHFASVIRQNNVERTLACATSAARDVSNGNELVEMGARWGIPIQIISGEQEAEYTFWGTLHQDLREPIVIVDVGGGSTEFILGDETGLVARQSLDIGSVRLTEMFVKTHPVPTEDMQAMMAYVLEKLRELRRRFPADEVVRLTAVAGTPTTLATLDQGLPFETDRVDGYILPLSQIRAWVQRLANMTIEERQALAGMEPKRADVIVAGALILMLSCQCFQAREIEVSVRGLRYGIAKFLGSKSL